MKKNILFLFGFVVFINSFYVFGGSGEVKVKGRLSKLKENNSLQFYKYTPRSSVTNKLVEILSKEGLAKFAGVGNGATIKLTDLISRELFYALENNSQFARVSLFDSYCFEKREIGSIEVSDDGNYLVIVSVDFDIVIFDFKQGDFLEINLNAKVEENNIDDEYSSDDESISDAQDWVVHTALSPDLKLALVSHKGIFELWCLKRKACLFRSATTSLDLDKDIAECRGVGFVKYGQSLVVYHKDVNRIWSIFEYDGSVAFKPLCKFRYEGRGAAKAHFFGQDIKRMLFIAPKDDSQTDHDVGLYNAWLNRDLGTFHKGIVNSGIDSRKKQAGLCSPKRLNTPMSCESSNKTTYR